MTAPLDNEQALLCAIAAAVKFYSPSTSSAERQAADKCLQNFQASDLAAPLSFALLSALAGQENGSKRLTAWSLHASSVLQSAATSAEASAVALFLATTLRRAFGRRSPRNSSSRDQGCLPLCEDLLELGAFFLVRGNRAVAEQLARSAAVSCLQAEQLSHAVELHLEALLLASGSDNNASKAVVLLAYAAIPEEVSARDIELGPKRSQSLDDMRVLSPRVVRSLGTHVSVESDVCNCCGRGELDILRLQAAAAWLLVGSFDVPSLVVLAEEVPLLPLAGHGLQSPHACTRFAAETFLEALVVQSSSAGACPHILVDSVTRSLSASWSTCTSQKHAAMGLCDQDQLLAITRLVALAVDVWKTHFISANTASPAPTWESLLQLMLECTRHSVYAAQVALPAWGALHEYAAAAGVLQVYTPVLCKVVGTMRAVVVTRLDASLEALDAVADFRQDLLSLLEQFVAPPVAVNTLTELICKDLLRHAKAAQNGSRSREHLALLEEALYSAAAIASQVAIAADVLPHLAKEDQNAETSGMEPARHLLEALELLCKDGELLLCNGHELPCAFLTCAAAAVPVLRLPQRQPSVYPSAAADRLLACTFEITAASLQIPEISSGGSKFESARHGFHAGIACLLAITEACGDQLARSAGPEVLEKLRAELHRRVCAAQCGPAMADHGAGFQKRHASVLALARALAAIAMHDCALAEKLFTDCLKLVQQTSSSNGAETALACTADVVKCCGAAQPRALASAFTSVWSMLGEQSGLHRSALADLLTALTEAATLDLLPAVAQFLAKLAQSLHEEGSLQVLFTPSTAFFLRASCTCREAPRLVPFAEHVTPVTGYAGELIVGLSKLAWSACRSSLIESSCNATQQAANTALLEGWLAFILQVARRAPQALESVCTDAVAMAITAVACNLSKFHKCRYGGRPEGVRGTSYAEQQECGISQYGLELLAELGTAPALLHGEHVRSALLTSVPAELSAKGCRSLGASGLSGLVLLLDMTACHVPNMYSVTQQARKVGNLRLSSASSAKGITGNGNSAVPSKGAIVSAASGLLRIAGALEFESFVKQVAEAHNVSDLQASVIKAGITRPSALHLERLLRQLVGSKSTCNATF